MDNLDIYLTEEDIVSKNGGTLAPRYDTEKELKENFMKKFVHKGKYWEVETNQGTFIVPADVAGEKADKEDLKDYVEGRITGEPELKDGFYGRYSAPGYLDATDWLSGKTEKEVVDELESLYGDDEPLEESLKIEFKEEPKDVEIYLTEEDMPKEDDEEKPKKATKEDIEKMKKEIRPWKWADNNEDAMAVSSFVKGFPEGFNDLLDSTTEYQSDVAHEIAKETLKENDFDADENQDALEELRMEAEEKMDFNVGAIAPNEMFVKPDDAIEFSDMTADEEQKKEDFDAMKKMAEKHGFTDKEIQEVLDNATYGGMGGVGAIVDGSTLVKVPHEGEVEAMGTPIMYIHDRLNGSGHYVIGSNKNGSVHLKFKNRKELADSIDEGKYSLGDVFGTRDWEWR